MCETTFVIVTRGHVLTKRSSLAGIASTSTLPRVEHAERVLVRSRCGSILVLLSFLIHGISQSKLETEHCVRHIVCRNVFITRIKRGLRREEGRRCRCYESRSASFVVCGEVEVFTTLYQCEGRKVGGVGVTKDETPATCSWGSPVFTTLYQITNSFEFLKGLFWVP